MILPEIFRVVSRLPRYISCYIAENQFPLGQRSVRYRRALLLLYSTICGGFSTHSNIFVIEQGIGLPGSVRV